jgi:hypothetical protein
MLENRGGSGTFKDLGATPAVLLCLLLLAPSCGTARASRANRTDRTNVETAAFRTDTSPALSDVAGALLALRRKHSALMTELTEPRTRSFDAIAAEVAEIDGQYQRAMIGAARLSPALAGRLEASGPDDQEQRLLAVTSGLLKVATAPDVQ